MRRPRREEQPLRRKQQCGTEILLFFLSVICIQNYVISHGLYHRFISLYMMYTFPLPNLLTFMLCKCFGKR